jgi:hypothetical protein
MQFTQPKFARAIIFSFSEKGGIMEHPAIVDGNGFDGHFEFGRLK